MTSLYLAKRLEPLNLQVTRLASGLPMGAQMDYADELTLIRALEGRKKL
jgi:recombination protein RecR